MRLVSWNLGCAYGSVYKTSQPRTWKQLLAWAPDIAFVQETLEPVGWVEPESYLFTPYGWSKSYAKPIGTLIYAASGSLNRVDLGLDQLLPGQVTAADLLMPGGANPLLLACIHAATTAMDPTTLPDDLDSSIAASHTAKVYPIDVIRHELTHLTAGRRFIVGGDLNLSVRFDDLYTSGSDLFGNVEWFNRARAVGWWNAHRKFHTGDQRTLFRPGKADELFQIDHVFTDKETWTGLESCDVLEVPFLDEFTDHAPIALKVSEF